MREVAPLALIEALQACQRVLLTGPAEPDGDSLGACLALQRILTARGVHTTVTGEVPSRYAWMPGAADFVGEDAIEPNFDAVVVLDGDRHRLPPRASDAFSAARVKGIVDHHASTRPAGYTHSWIAADATSTCEMLYDALAPWGHPLDHDLAILLYVGAIFDTGGFRYSNTTPATHRMAAVLLETGIDHATICARVLMERRISGLRIAGEIYSEAELHLDGALAIGTLCRTEAERLQLVPGDLEGLVDTLLYTTGVEVAALLVERQGALVKASFRSRGRVNVSTVAQRLVPTGGGHAKAAGAVLSGDLDHVRARTVEEVRASLIASDRRALV